MVSNQISPCMGVGEVGAVAASVTTFPVVSLVPLALMLVTRWAKPTFEQSSIIKPMTMAIGSLLNLLFEVFACIFLQFNFLYAFCASIPWALNGLYLPKRIFSREKYALLEGQCVVYLIHCTSKTSSV